MRAYPWAGLPWAHPFLVYSFAIQLNGGWNYEFMLDHVERLKGLELGDIET